MNDGIFDQARRLDRAERRWLDEARARLRRTTLAAPAGEPEPTEGGPR